MRFGGFLGGFTPKIQIREIKLNPSVRNRAFSNFFFNGKNQVFGTRKWKTLSKKLEIGVLTVA